MMATLAATIGRGTLAARPATMPVGSLYYVTDTSTLYRSNGAGWDSIEAATTAGYTDEQARDAIGTALTAGAGITITPNDPADTITIAATGTVVGTHTHTAADVSDFSEATDDRAAALIVAGSGITTTYNDVANTLTIAASAGSGPVPGMLPGWITGRWYSMFQVISSNTVGGNVVLANRLYVMPLAVPRACSVDRIGVNVTTLGTAATIRLGIYNAATDGTPGTRLLDAGTVPGTAVGPQELTIAQALAAGWYWLALITNVSLQVSSIVSTFGPDLLGQTGTAGSTKGVGWGVTNAAYFTALPNPIAGLTVESNGPLPMVRCA